jgi:protease-4
MHRRVIALLAFLLPGCFNGLLLKPTNVSGPVEELTVTPSCSWFCCDKIALIDVEGLIANARSSGLLGSGENPVSLFRERLDAAALDSHVKAVVLRINSPGGAVTASDIMYQEVLRFRHETGKPVVACMMDVAASGGYYVAMACDKVYAHPTTVTGSIGVIMSLFDASGLLRVAGVTSEPIKSGPNKDLGSPTRPLTEKEREILQGMVDGFYDQFVEVVVRGRAHAHLTKEQVRALADGRVYTGVQAQKLGLVDEVGYLEDALQAALDMACLKDATVIAYDKCEGYRGSIYAQTPHFPSQINVKLDLPGLGGPEAAGFMYLWKPGVVR